MAPKITNAVPAVSEARIRHFTELAQSMAMNLGLTPHEAAVGNFILLALHIEGTMHMGTTQMERIARRMEGDPAQVGEIMAAFMQPEVLELERRRLTKYMRWGEESVTAYIGYTNPEKPPVYYKLVRKVEGEDGGE